MTTSDDRLYPADWQHGVRYAGIYSFMGAPISRDLSRADVAIVGVPFDTGVNHRPGARFGPRGVQQIREGFAPIFEAGVPPIALGGDHTISLPILRAAHPHHGPVSLVHFDAHPDFWKPAEGRPYHHGTVFRIAADEGLISLPHSIQVGIRGTISGEVVEEARDAG